MENQIIRHNLKYHQVVPNIVLSITCETLPFFSALHEGHGRPRSVRKSSRLRWKCLSMDCRCSDIANLSVHLHRLPTPPPFLRQMRLSPGRVRGCWVLDETFASQGRRCWVANDAASCPWRSSCKSPRARIPVLSTSGAHWPARWPRFVLTEHGFES